MDLAYFLNKLIFFICKFSPFRQKFLFGGFRMLNNFEHFFNKSMISFHKLVNRLRTVEEELQINFFELSTITLGGFFPKSSYVTLFLLMFTLTVVLRCGLVKELKASQVVLNNSNNYCQYTRLSWCLILIEWYIVSVNVGCLFYIFYFS